MEDIQVTDRAVFNDAPPEVLKRLAVNRQSNHFFFFFCRCILLLHLYKCEEIFVNSSEITR